MGFLLAGMGIAMLFLSVVLFLHVFGDDWTGLYEAITGFGLGGSAIALFGRCAAGPFEGYSRIVMIMQPRSYLDVADSSGVRINCCVFGVWSGSHK